MYNDNKFPLIFSRFESYTCKSNDLNFASTFSNNKKLWCSNIQTSISLNQIVNKNIYNKNNQFTTDNTY